MDVVMDVEISRDKLLQLKEFLKSDLYVNCVLPLINSRIDQYKERLVASNDDVVRGKVQGLREWHNMLVLASEIVDTENKTE